MPVTNEDLTPWRRAGRLLYDILVSLDLEIGDGIQSAPRASWRLITPPDRELTLPPSAKKIVVDGASSLALLGPSGIAVGQMGVRPGLVGATCFQAVQRLDELRINVLLQRVGQQDSIRRRMIGTRHALNHRRARATRRRPRSR